MSKGIHRRDFFKVLAAGGAGTAVLAGCSDKPEQLIPYLVPPTNVEFTPGNPLAYATTCTECPAGCGMVVETREARAIKAEGNPDHLVNQGALCIRGQASLQTHYNPARITQAMQREGEEWKPLPWEQAETELAGRIQAVEDPRRIVYMTGHAAGTRGRFLDEWLGALGAAPKVVLEPLSLHNVRAANQRTFFRNEIPQYRIADAGYLLNFGAEFLETWNSPVRQNREFAAAHAVSEEKPSRAKFVHVGPHVSLTAANADQRLLVRPGSETVVALAMAREVLGRRRSRLNGTEAERLADFLEPYTAERAAEAAGVDAETLRAVAGEFAAADPGLALAGGNSVATTAGTQTQVAVNLLNYVAGNVGRTVMFGASQQVDVSTPYGEVQQVVERMRRGDVDLLIVDGANPVYHLPPGSGIAEALEKVGTVVSLSPAWDETTGRAHYVLPGLSPLERWGDSFPQKGVYSLQQPVMAPLYPLKQPEDTLLAVAAQLGLAPFQDVDSYRTYLQDAWRNVQQEAGNTQPFDDFWRQALQRGGVFQEITVSSTVRLNPQALQEQPEPLEFEGEGLVLVPTVSLRHRDGRGASNPWLQEIPDPVSQVVWDSWADINPRTARKLGIAHGELITVASPHGEVQVAAYMHYGVHEDAIAIPLGQGHTDSGRDADLRGVNVMGLLPPEKDGTSGEFAYVTTRVSVSGTGERAFLVQLDGSPRQLGRGIVQTMTLEQVAAGEAPHAGEHAERHRDFYGERDETPGYYEPYRWGMTVDVDRCTGCSACAAACYAENNVPVVGKERAALGREMSWLRIERFYEGEGEGYRTLMQPMFCQHCSNAGCEPVCPVYATYHTPEGLNAQVYNRCVGTRYCSNNCAYKVRRFNWFDYIWPEPLHMQLNPDVSVRSKGVMEKCTFCVQRIKRAEIDARGQGRELRDGDVTPACVQTCPTGALTFGNLTDGDSAVSRRARRGEGAHRVRQYEVLEEARNLPAVTYLRQVTLDDHEKEA